MKAITLGLVLLAGTAPPAASVGPLTDLERAETATAAFAAALKGELVQAMQSGGAIEAIEVCHSRADAIAHEVSGKYGLKVSRVSLKNRNPGNAPNEWQKSVLEAFEDRKLAGESPGALTWSETAGFGDNTEFRYMKAIPAGGLCLQCHGETLAEPLAGKLQELYPDDRATGYREGDLRGAFVVTRRQDP
ncbi:MAG: DUF3365 domain-containing protein [Xanthomonadales bacterium]|nr:DUF3365 domain-containing protein [Gammaproteobacteria bacterium]NNK38199.1 DUF3365 domain-containing protein [Xanthomonadales bacterium]